MSIAEIGLLTVAVFVGVPVLSYLTAKFATTGYLRARDRHERRRSQVSQETKQPIHQEGDRKCQDPEA